MTKQPLGPAVLLLWNELGDERVPTLRDNEGRLLYPFNEYLDDISLELHRRKASPSQRKSHLESATYAIKSLCSFLATRGRTVLQLDDTLLREFRDDALERVMKSKTFRGDENASKRTVNAKLRHVYQLLFKCQKGHRLPKRTIGPTRCKVQSSWPLLDEAPTNILNEDRRKHPLCFRAVGENSREDNSQHFATRKDIVKLEELFWRQASPIASYRNIMMLRVASLMGWRVASLNSLETRQFSQAALASQAHLDDFTVVPPHQKGGYSYAFSMPFELACQVAEFVAGPRAQCLEALGVAESVTEGRIFLSARTGKPLCNHSVSELFADAFKKLGAPPGSGAHSLRRFVGQETANDEVAFRRANNLSLAREDVERAIQEKLGHANVLSQRVYRRAISKLRTSDEVSRLRNELLEQQGKNLRLNSDLKAAAQAIKDLESALASGTSRPRRKKVPAPRRLRAPRDTTLRANS